MYLGAALCMVILRAWKIGQIEGEKAAERMSHGDLEPDSATETREKEDIKVVSPFLSRVFKWQKV
jgi:hypothetical protein